MLSRQRRRAAQKVVSKEISRKETRNLRGRRRTLSVSAVASEAILLDSARKVINRMATPQVVGFLRIVLSSQRARKILSQCTRQASKLRSCVTPILQRFGLPTAAPQPT